MDDIDPLAGQIGKSREVRRCCKPLRLETAHLAWRSRTILRRLAADNPAYGRIMPQALGSFLRDLAEVWAAHGRTGTR